MVAAIESPNGVIQGYLPAVRPRYRWVEFGADGAEAGDGDGVSNPGGEPFRAEVRTNLTFGELEELGASNLFVDIWARCAPHVRAWNALGIDAATGEPAPVPPPAESGPDAFLAIDMESGLWLWRTLQKAYQGGEERGKGGTRPAPSDSPPNDDD